MARDLKRLLNFKYINSELNLNVSQMVESSIKNFKASSPFKRTEFKFFKQRANFHFDTKMSMVRNSQDEKVRR